MNTHFEKSRADVVIANVPGAIDVVNRISVDCPRQPKPDKEIEEDTIRRLGWSPLLYAERGNGVDAIVPAIDPSGFTS